ncbi:MAG: PIN domain-containing protein [Granulosicoccus sp.]
MIVCDTGPIVSAINKSEKRRNLFAAELLVRLVRKVIVPWPVLVETDLLLRSRDFPSAAIIFGESMATDVHRLESPTAAADLELALKLGKRYSDSGTGLPDLIVMAMAHHHKAQILTWNFRHFRSVVLKRVHHWLLLVSETEMPRP